MGVRRGGAGVGKMDLIKLDIEQMRAYDKQRLLEVEEDLRKEINKLKMDIFAEKGKHSGKINSLKKNLSRILTVKNSHENESGKG